MGYNFGNFPESQPIQEYDFTFPYKNVHVNCLHITFRNIQQDCSCMLVDACTCKHMHANCFQVHANYFYRIGENFGEFVAGKLWRI